MAANFVVGGNGAEPMGNPLPTTMGFLLCKFRKTQHLWFSNNVIKHHVRTVQAIKSTLVFIHTVNHGKLPVIHETRLLRAFGLSPLKY